MQRVTLRKPILNEGKTFLLSVVMKLIKIHCNQNSQKEQQQQQKQQQQMIDIIGTMQSHMKLLKFFFLRVAQIIPILLHMHGVINRLQFAYNLFVLMKFPPLINYKI